MPGSRWRDGCETWRPPPARAAPRTGAAGARSPARPRGGARSAASPEQPPSNEGQRRWSASLKHTHSPLPYQTAGAMAFNSKAPRRAGTSDTGSAGWCTVGPSRRSPPRASCARPPASPAVPISARQREALSARCGGSQGAHQRASSGRGRADARFWGGVIPSSAAGWKSRATARQSHSAARRTPAAGAHQLNHPQPQNMLGRKLRAEDQEQVRAVRAIPHCILDH